MRVLSLLLVGAVFAWSAQLAYADGACCVVSGACVIVADAAECAGIYGIYIGDGTTCDPDPCATGACCIGYVTTPDCVQVASEQECWNNYLGVWNGPGSTCETITCPEYGACCWPGVGVCLQRREVMCTAQGFDWLGPGIPCDPNPCPQPTGACCLGDVCQELEEAECLAQGGTYTWDNNPCEPGLCEHGACCFPTQGCLELAKWWCEYSFGIFMGSGTTCYPDPCAGFSEEWSDNFDSYPDGTLLYHVGGWTGWDDDPAAAGVVSSAQAHSPPHSIMVNDTADAVRPMTPWKSGGQWVFTTWQYIPSGLSGSTYFIMHSYYEHGGPYFGMIQLQFDPASGQVIDDLRSACGTLPLVYDQWVEIRLEIDFTTPLGTVNEYYNGQLLCTGDWIAGSVGQFYIANIDLWAPHSTPVYYDDFLLEPVGGPPEPARPLFIGRGATNTVTFTSDLAGYPDSIVWREGFLNEKGIEGAAARPDGVLYLFSGSTDRRLYHAPFQGPPIEICRAASSSWALSSLAYRRGTLYGYKNSTTGGPLGIYSVSTDKQPTPNAPGSVLCDMELVCASGSYRFFAMDYNPADDLLYGYTEYGSPTGLYSINVDTCEMIHIANRPPVSNSAGRGMAIGYNKVYVVPSNMADAIWVYDLAQGPGGTWQMMTPHPTGANLGSTGAAFAPGHVPGDTNCDGVINFNDIDPFVVALVSQAEFEAAYPGCYFYNADADGNGIVNFDDIDPFVVLLVGG